MATWVLLEGEGRPEKHVCWRLAAVLRSCNLALGRAGDAAMSHVAMADFA